MPKLVICIGVASCIVLASYTLVRWTYLNAQTNEFKHNPWPQLSICQVPEKYSDSAENDCPLGSPQPETKPGTSTLLVFHFDNSSRDGYDNVAVTAQPEIPGWKQVSDQPIVKNTARHGSDADGLVVGLLEKSGAGARLAFKIPPSTKPSNYKLCITSIEGVRPLVLQCAPLAVK